MHVDPAGEPDLNVSVASQAPVVPVFSCIAYVSTIAGGAVQARVANLAGVECTAATERDALGMIIPAFKRRVGELMQSGTPVPWIEPPAPAKPGEQTRFIPVHL